MGAYSSTKTFWDKLTNPFVLGGWLLLPFFGAMTNAAHAANPDAGTIENLSAFYGPVAADPVGSVTGFGTFIADAATDTATLGGHVLSGLGVKVAGTGLSMAFSFATGAAVVGAGLYAAYKISDAIFSAKPQPA